METPEKVQFNIVEPGSHTILFGDAEKTIYPKSINLTGVLSAPVNFLKGKTAEFKKEAAHLLIDPDDNTMTLNLDERSEKSAVQIVGKLTPDKDLMEWKINSEHRWTVASLLKHVRERKFYFKDTSVQAKLINSLQKWNAQVEVVIKQHNDNSGNSLAMLERKVGEIDLVKEFVLSIPLFKGYEKREFTVNIGLDPKSSQVDFFLYSDELFFLMRSDRDMLFAKEVEAFKALKFDCSVVHLS